MNEEQSGSLVQARFDSTNLKNAACSASVSSWHTLASGWPPQAPTSIASPTVVRTAPRMRLVHFHGSVLAITNRCSSPGRHARRQFERRFGAAASRFRVSDNQRLCQIHARHHGRLTRISSVAELQWSPTYAYPHGGMPQ